MLNSEKTYPSVKHLLDVTCCRSCFLMLSELVCVTSSACCALGVGARAVWWCYYTSPTWTPREVKLAFNVAARQMLNKVASSTCGSECNASVLFAVCRKPCASVSSSLPWDRVMQWCHASRFWCIPGKLLLEWLCVWKLRYSCARVFVWYCLHSMCAFCIELTVQIYCKS